MSNKVGKSVWTRRFALSDLFLCGAFAVSLAGMTYIPGWGNRVLLSCLVPLTGIALAAGIRRAFYPGAVKVRLTPLNGAVFLFATFLFISNLVSGKGMEEPLPTFAFLLVLTSLFLSSGENTGRERVIRFVVLMSVFEILFGTYLSLRQAGYTQFTGISGHFDNPAGLAVCLAGSLIFSLYLARTAGKQWYLYTSILAVGLFLTGSRAGMVAAVAGTIAWSWEKIPFARMVKGRRTGVIGRITSIVVMLSAMAAGLYLYKPRSADGRGFIWRNTREMILERPVAGYGGSRSFADRYMEYQARFFEENPESEMALLADDVFHPFNEYLLVWVQYGIIGLLLLILCCVALFCTGTRKDSVQGAAKGVLLAVLAAGCFSYPFRYVYTFLLVLLCLDLLSREEKRTVFVQRFIPTVLAVAAALLLYPTAEKEVRWRWTEHIPNEDLRLESCQRLYYQGYRNTQFVYNLVRELRNREEFGASATIIESNPARMSFYNAVILQGENYFHLRRFDEAEESFLRAHRMCPVRFTPLIELLDLYKETGDTTKGKRIAHQILEKEVKIPSFQVNSIRTGARIYLLRLKNEEGK